MMRKFTLLYVRILVISLSLGNQELAASWDLQNQVLNGLVLLTISLSLEIQEVAVSRELQNLVINELVWRMAESFPLFGAVVGHE